MTARRLVILFVAIGLALVAACRQGGAPTRGEVYVYVAVPLSGFQANGGQTVLGGVRLAAEQINRDGGLLGYQVVVRPLDDESDSDVAAARVDEIQQAIRDGDRVLGVIGHLNSGQTAAAMAQYREMPIIVITPTASEQSLTEQGFTNFFRVNANDTVQASVAAAFLVNQLGARNVAVIHNDTDYGQKLAAGVIQELERRGGRSVVRLQVTEGQSRFDTEIGRIAQESPDAIFYAGYEIEAPYLRASLVENNVTVPMLASDGAFLAATIDEAAGTAEGMYVSAFAPSPNNVADSRWLEAYQAVEYRNPDTYSVNGYVAMQVLAAGARRADSLESTAVAAALHGGTADTLLGQLRFEEDGDLIDPEIWIYQVTGGEFEQVDAAR